LFQLQVVWTWFTGADESLVGRHARINEVAAVGDAGVRRSMHTKELALLSSATLGKAHLRPKRLKDQENRAAGEL
jgi:hypothetical protein